MKKCSRCSFENPSKANFCLSCGAALGNEILSEEIQLKKKLEEANATIDVLRKSLSIAQQQLENNGSTEELQLLQNQIEEKELKIQNLKDALEKTASDLSETKQELEEIAKLPKKGGKWGWVFVLLFVAVAILSILLWDNNKGLESSIHAMEERNSSEVSKLRDEISEQAESLRQLEEEKGKISKELKELKNDITSIPLIITDIKIANTTYDGDIQTYYGNTLYSSNTMYLQPKIYYKGLQEGNFSFKIKWFNPDGSVRGNSSINGYTYSCSRYVYRNLGQVNELELSGWGNSSRGHWRRGTYRLEIWVGNVCLKSTSVTIY